MSSSLRLGLVASAFVLCASVVTRAEVAPPPPSPPPEPKPARFEPNDWKHSLGAYGRYMFVTELMFRPYADVSTGLTRGYAAGIQYTRHYDKFDVVTSVDFSWLAPDSGNWLARGNDPVLDTKYVQFDRLSLLSLDVAIIGHHAFNRWVEIRGGAGLGVGYVFGDVYTTNNSNQVCNRDNAADTSKCYPISPTAGPIYLNRPDTEDKLKATEDPAHENTAANPHRKKEFKPPAMAVVNIMMALKFRVQRHLAMQVEVGFRDAMFVGFGLHSLF